jgi:hypothetical protein
LVSSVAPYHPFGVTSMIAGAGVEPRLGYEARRSLAALLTSRGATHRMAP